MSAVKNKNTSIELCLRRLLWSEGIRGYRVNYKLLPGKPDIAFTKRKVAIFIHGAFWHGHQSVKQMPKTNSEYWKDKIERNKVRDAKNEKTLIEMGYRVIIIWDFELKNPRTILERIRKALG